jgi:hypothetical protein
VIRPGGRIVVVGAVGPQFVGGGEHAVEIAQAAQIRQRRHLVHDHLG